MADLKAPDDLKYTDSDEWVRIEGEIATLGLTDYAQDALNDIVYVELPEVGESVENCRRVGIDCMIFSDIKSNPTGESVQRGVRVFREGGHDGVIAFGGGSSMDAGKAIAFMSGQSMPLWEFEDIGDNWRRADPGGIAPTIAVPTTSGTGSEVGRAAVITDSGTRTVQIWST